MPRSTDDPRSESGTPAKVKTLDPKPAPAKAQKITLAKRDPWSGRSG